MEYSNIHIKTTRKTVNCHICNKDMLVIPYTFNRNRHFTCSKECLGKLRSINNSGIKHGRFNNQAGKIYQNCNNCSKEIKRYLNPIQKNNKFNFCSHKCRANFYSGEKNPRYSGGTNQEYGINWYKVKKIIRNRDKKCLFYKIEKDIDGTNCNVHHYIPLKLFIKIGNIDFEKANNINNLGLYCTKCHRIIEKISKLIWTKKFFNATNIINTTPTFKESIKNNFCCYSVYK
jgi:hypothetical protein